MFFALETFTLGLESEKIEKNDLMVILGDVGYRAGAGIMSEGIRALLCLLIISIRTFICL